MKVSEFILNEFKGKNVEVRILQDEGVTQKNGMYTGPITLRAMLEDYFVDEDTKDDYIILGSLPSWTVAEILKLDGGILPIKCLVKYKYVSYITAIEKKVVPKSSGKPSMFNPADYFEKENEQAKNYKDLTDSETPN